MPTDPDVSAEASRPLPRLFVAWAFVLVPLGWGVLQTLKKAWVLFQ
jgi:hypothetical protein